MKKALILLVVFAIFISVIAGITTNVYATNDNDIISQVEQPGTLIKLKSSQENTLKSYQERYGSDSYGLTAYILHLVQIYSIPFCFLGIVISIIYRVIIGARHLENLEKGLGMTVAIVTVTIICQVLPLIFAIVVKVGRE